jgi:hypothetical protein
MPFAIAHDNGEHETAPTLHDALVSIRQRYPDATIGSTQTGEFSPQRQQSETFAAAARMQVDGAMGREPELITAIETHRSRTHGPGADVDITVAVVSWQASAGRSRGEELSRSRGMHYE